MLYLSIKIKYLSRTQVSNIFQNEIPFISEVVRGSCLLTQNVIPSEYHFETYYPSCIFQGVTFGFNKYNPVRLQ